MIYMTTKINDGLTNHQRYVLRHPDYVKRQQIASDVSHAKDSGYRKRMILKAKERRQELRKVVIGLLGGKCANPECPIPQEKMDFRCLQIDHINGNGRADVRRYKKNIGSMQLKIYKEILAGSKDYQCLCAYCNWLKRFTNNELIVKVEQE